VLHTSYNEQQEKVLYIGGKYLLLKDVWTGRDASKQQYKTNQYETLLLTYFCYLFSSGGFRVREGIPVRRIECPISLISWPMTLAMAVWGVMPEAHSDTAF